MTTTRNVIFDGGELVLASEDDRTVEGLLLPFNTLGHTNIGAFTVEASVLTLPADPEVIGLNIDHDREQPVGRAIKVEERQDGVYARYRIAKTPEGDQALADIKSGKRKSLSMEAKGVIVRAGKAIKGHLFGSALVPEPAFSGATVIAALNEDGTVEQAAPDTPTEFIPDENGDIAITATETPATVTVTSGDTTTVYDPQTADTEGEPDVAAPDTLTAAKATGTKTKSTGPDLQTVYAAIAKAKAGDEDARTVLAALSDIKISGTGALPAAGVLRENWVGPVWQGKTYERQYINLSKLGTDINAQGKKGFKIHRGTSSSPKDSLGGDWAGNKTDVPTGQGYTETLGSTLARFAFAADIAREFIDLPGGQEVVEAFIRLIVEDYAVWSDNKALSTYVATAGTPIAPNTYPTQYNQSLGQLVQGILAVKRAKDVPSYAIVNSTAYEQLIYTPKDLVPEFVSFEFTTELTGTADGGKVSVVEAPDEAFTGIEAGAPAVLVGAKNAIEFDELGSTPIQVDALEIAKGGIDRALHGYLQTFVVRPEALVLVGEAAA